MLKILSTLVDRCIFTLTFILGLQLPEFIQQYTQRLSGHVNEALLQLNEYQLIANRYFDGDLTSMIDKYLMNNESSIKETANIIINTSNRVSKLQEHLLNLQQADYVKRVYYFITQFDQSMAQATIEQYQLAIPLNLSSFITGAIFAITILLTSHLIIKGIKRLVLNITLGNLSSG